MLSGETHPDGPIATTPATELIAGREDLPLEASNVDTDRRASEEISVIAPVAVPKSATRRTASESMFWLRRADQIMLGVLLVILLVLLVAFRWKLSGGWRTNIEIVSQQPREYFYAIDINRASWVEWAQLDGIGEKLGRRIVQDRLDHGSFHSIDDLHRVRGLGPKLIEKLRPFLKCTNDELPQTTDAVSTTKELR